MPQARAELLRSGLISLLLGFALLAAITAGTVWFVHSEQQNLAGTRQAVDVKTQLTTVFSLLQDAETGQRGYLLTGEAPYLAPYQHATVALPPALGRLQHALSYNVSQIPALAIVRALIAEKLNELQSTLALRQAGQPDAAVALVRAGAGKATMDRLRSEVGHMLAVEDDEIIARQARTDSAGISLQRSIFGASIMLAVVAIGTLWMFLRQIRGVMVSRDAVRDAHERLVQEMTQREQLEEQLRQSQKMEALGQLTGGLAHDLNNMLAVIIGSLNLLERRRTRGETDLRRFVDAALEAAQRAATLTQRLLAFSRRQPLSPQVIDVNKFVAGISELLQRTLGASVQLETVLAGGLWRTHADASQLESALLNLAINSRDAMPDGGKLTIETGNAHLDDAYAARHADVPAGQYVLVAVSDTGTGMPPEVARQAFDPFFTTKGVGKGTGLGLSQVYGFVKQSSGHVKIYSEPGDGTTIKLYLPRFFAVDVAADAGDPTAEPKLATATAPTTVLVVEDEERVRLLAVESLRELGYTVLQADGAVAALRLIDSHPEIVLIFTDIVMPEVNGRRFAEEALRRRPSLRVLYTTGYTRNAIVHNGVLDPGVQLIAKPYSLEQLSHKLREVLEAPGTAAPS